jgi:hypothetical protein
MAAILKCNSQSGQTIYAVIHDAAGKYWNGSSFEVFNSANWATYLNLLTEDGTTGYYKATFPAAIAAGYYDYIYYASTTYGDTNIGGNIIYFDGTSEEQGIAYILKTYLLDKIAKVTMGGTPPTIGSLFDLLMNKDSGQTFAQATDSLQAIVAGGSSGPSAATIAAAVWNEAMSGHVTAGTAGVDLKAIVAALPSGTISNFNPASQTVNLGASQTGVTIGTVNALGSSALASILTQIRTALSSDTMTELTGITGAQPTIHQALMLLYMSLRNEHTATGSQEKIYNNSGSTITTATVSDDGTTYTKGQFT